MVEKKKRIQPHHSAAFADYAQIASAQHVGLLALCTARCSIATR
jgi:hypothetical protein